MDLLKIEESYNLRTVEEDSRNAVKKRFKPCEEQSIEEYEQELEDEIRLEIAYRLRKIADQLEEKALKEQRQTIRLIYNEKGKLTVFER